MPDEEHGSVTSWISLIKQGDQDAAEKLWERYFARLVRLARAKLLAARRGIAEADEEDAALSAFDSFCAGAARGQFPKLSDRDSLWRLLVVITLRKVSDQIARRGRKKRGAGHVVNESALFDGSVGLDAGLEAMIGHEPTPEFAAMIAEEVQQLLQALGDDAIRRVAIWRLEGYTKEEIARKLDCSPRTVAYKVEFIRKTWLARVSQ
jgi:DNA-directed RNA polymerase specialized sigma24 family protein